MSSDAEKAYRKRYYETNKEQRRIAAVIRHRQLMQSEEGRARVTKSRTSFNESPKGRWKSTQRNAHTRGLAMTLSLERFTELTSQRCFYCGGYSKDKKTNSKERTFTGLDRIDNSKGYVEGNVCPCCFLCNKMKGTIPTDLWLEQMRRIIKFSI